MEFMEFAIQWEVSEVINKMIKKLENREKKNSYQKKYYNNNKEIYKKANKKYQQSEKGKKTMRRYWQSEKGREIIRKSGKKWRKKNPEKFKEINNRCHSKRREKILKRREEEDIVPTIVGGAGEILSTGYKRRNWTKKDEEVLRECKRRCKSPYKKAMTWKQIGIKLNRPQKQIREKWRQMIQKDKEDSDEEIVLQPNIGF